MAQTKMMSFADIIQGRNAKVRVTDDNLLDTVEVIMAMNGYTRCYSSQVIARIPADSFDHGKFIERNLSSRGGHKTKLLTFQDTIDFIMVLPGQGAKAVRQQFARIIREYIAGERSLIAEIEANAESNAPLAQLARAASPVQSDETTVGFRRRREELELFKLEEEVRAMSRARLANIKNDLEELTTPSASNLDDRTRLMIKDSYMNLLTTPLGSSGRQAQLTDGTSTGLNAPIGPGSFLTVSVVAADLGYRFNASQLTRVGGWIAKAYFSKYNESPPKHEQFVGGAAIKVNTYQSKDRDLLEAEIRRFANKENLAARL